MDWGRRVDGIYACLFNSLPPPPCLCVARPPTHLVGAIWQRAAAGDGEGHCARVLAGPGVAAAVVAVVVCVLAVVVCVLALLLLHFGPVCPKGKGRNLVVYSKCYITSAFFTSCQMQPESHQL